MSTKLNNNAMFQAFGDDYKIMSGISGGNAMRILNMQPRGARERRLSPSENEVANLVAQALE